VGRTPLWTGLYFGVNLGYGWGHGDIGLTAGALPRQTLSDDFEGVLGGGQIGYNWQQGQVVFGVETDFQGTGQQHSSGTAVVVTNKLPWFGTVRGRVGIVNSGFLTYATGGLAYGEFKSDITAGPAKASVSTSWNGWTLGAGVEAAIHQGWTARVEYLYIDTGNFINGSVNLGAAAANFDVSGHDHIVRVGLNYWW
jgi:outer membrane immunogenic protein